MKKIFFVIVILFVAIIYNGCLTVSYKAVLQLSNYDCFTWNVTVGDVYKSIGPYDTVEYYLEWSDYECHTFDVSGRSDYGVFYSTLYICNGERTSKYVYTGICDGFANREKKVDKQLDEAANLLQNAKIEINKGDMK